MSHHGSLATQPTGHRAQVLILEGVFDGSNSDRFERAIDDAIDAGRPDVIVDLRGVSFLDSKMLRALVRGLDRTRAEDRRFALIRPNPHVWRVFVLTGLSRALPAFGGVADALTSFAAVAGGARIRSSAVPSSFRGTGGTR